MLRFLSKTFGGLSRSYYLRHLVFALVMATLFIGMLSQGSGPAIKPEIYVLFFINTLLYPYSRFVYESLVGFIVGNNVFFVNAVLMLIAKFMTMVMCWSMAIFIAPFGLVYLYWYHSRRTMDS